MYFRDKKGLVFLIALVFVLVVALGAAAFMALSTNEITIMRNQNNSTRAFYIAEAGIERAVAWLRSQATPPIAVVGPVNQNLAATGYAGSYRYNIAPNPGNPVPPALGIYVYTVTSTSTIGIATRSIITQETMELNTFARYSYFTSNESFLIWWWEIPVWFTTGTLLEGPVHTNDQYHISGDPIFDGPVSSVATTIDYMHGGPPNDNPQFRQGLTLGADPVDTALLTSNILQAAAAGVGGYTFNGNTEIVLIGNGTMDVTNSNLVPPMQNMPLPVNGAVFVTNGDLGISGTLDGRLTVGSSRDVIIRDDIRYANDPRVNPNSDDILAIMSDRDIIVDEHAADGNPQRDLDIFATLIAIGETPPHEDDDGSLYVERYWSGLKGLLTVYGGLIQKRRGPVGTFNSRTNRRVSGYDKDYHFDIRMNANPPPHIPRIITFGRLSWQEV